MEQFIEHLFGSGDELGVLQMSARAFLMFFIALILVRISGRRSFGAGSPFDNIVVIMLGAILSRGVVGASPLVSTIGAGIVICVVHRLLAILAARSHTAGRYLKGGHGLLYKNGELNKKAMQRFNLSVGDVEQGVRLAGNVGSLEEVREVWMERSGQISVIK